MMSPRDWILIEYLSPQCFEKADPPPPSMTLDPNAPTLEGNRHSRRAAAAQRRRRR